MIRKEPYFGIYAAIFRLRPGEQIKGIDSNMLAVVFIQRRTSGYAVGIEYETEDVDGYFTHKNHGIVDSVDEALEFFKNYVLGNIYWIKENKEIYDEEVA